MRSLVLSCLVFALSTGALLDTEYGALQPRQETAAESCSSLHMIVARATTETPGLGSIRVVASAVCDAIPDCDAYGVIYPATALSFANYVDSEANGTASLMSDIHAYHTSCPDTPIALLGFSQGAQAVGDVICGTTSSSWNRTLPIHGRVLKRIIAVIQMGDPSHTLGLPFNVGTATRDGYFPRTNTSSCAPFYNKTQAYCDAEDTYCDSGNSLDVHHGYMPEYGPAAASFVVEKYSSYTSVLAASSSRAAAKRTTTTSTIESTTTSDEDTRSEATTTANPRSTGEATTTTPGSTTATSATSATATGGAAKAATMTGGGATVVTTVALMLVCFLINSLAMSACFR